jgi:hypothetical protein
MKHYYCLSVILLMAGCASAQTTTVTYEWKATIRAVDETGNPISEANADIGYYANSKPANALGITDTNGMFVASHAVPESLAEVSLQAGKPGYYTSWVKRLLGPKYDPSQWIFTQTLILKQVGHPIAMYAKWIRKNPPVLNPPIGFDLMVGDWVGPNGKGINTDIIFQGVDYRKSGADYEHTIKVSFPKSGDGIQSYTIPNSEAVSGLRSPHEAPLEGYQPELTKQRSAHPSQPAKNDDDPNHVYIFRVRTVLDEQGNVKGALYGKIYGDFMQFAYYLNPTPNSRNIEFDPKQNMLSGLQPFEQVTAP